jgi:3-oxoacyl-[acyl-carrier protein] reductase
MAQLKDHTVLITGSARGIGAATAREVTAQGGKPILHGRTESEHLVALAKELDASYIFCDSAERDQIEAAVAQISEPIHALINCAGTAIRKSFVEGDDEYWLAQYKVNLLGIVSFCRAVVPQMQQRNYGRIVNVSSLRANPQAAGAAAMAYAASKAAVENFTGSLAKEVAPNVNVNCVAPGLIETDLAKDWPAALWERGKSVLKGRVGQPAEVAALLTFLASPAASYITAQILTIDGGLLASGN